MTSTSAGIDLLTFCKMFPCDRCKGKNNKCDIIGVNKPKLDPEGEFYLHTVKRKCIQCGDISNLVYHFEKTERYFENITKKERIKKK